MYDRFLRKFITVIDRNKRGVSTKDAVVRSPYHVPTQSKQNSSRDLLKHTDNENSFYLSLFRYLSF